MSEVWASSSRLPAVREQRVHPVADEVSAAAGPLQLDGERARLARQAAGAFAPRPSAAIARSASWTPGSDVAERPRLAAPAADLVELGHERVRDLAEAPVELRATLLVALEIAGRGP